MSGEQIDRAQHTSMSALQMVAVVSAGDLLSQSILPRDDDARQRVRAVGEQKRLVRG